MPKKIIMCSSVAFLKMHTEVDLPDLSFNSFDQTGRSVFLLALTSLFGGSRYGLDTFFSQQVDVDSQTNGN
jgi:hypothetical protein